MAGLRRAAEQVELINRVAPRNPRVRRIVEAAPLVVMFLLFNASSARSGCSFNPAPDPTVDGSPTSLRRAIQMANASGQDCLITLQAGTYTLTIKNTKGHENAAAQGDLDITDSGHTVTIQGPGAGLSIVNGNGIDRPFHVLGGANAVFRNLTIEGGTARDNATPGALPGTTQAKGGGMLVEGGGQVTLTRVSLKGNLALGGNGALGTGSGAGASGQAAAGGALYVSSGAINLANCNISGNDTNGGNGGDGGGGRFLFAGGNGGDAGAGAGGGLYVSSGTLNLSSSIVSGNRATGGIGGTGGSVSPEVAPVGNGGLGQRGAGAGLYILSGTVKLSESTVSGNVAAGGTGGAGGVGVIGGGGGAPAGNGDGGGLFVSAGTLSLSASTVSGNSVTGGDGGPGVLSGGDGGSSRGAGMFVVGGSLSLANGTFFGNTANNGGAGGAASTSFSLGRGGDSAGGGLFVIGGSVYLAGLTVAFNRAEAGGGGGRTFPVPGSSLGGGICNSGAKSLVSDSTLIGNNTQDAASAGGGPDVSGKITASYSLISHTAGTTITDNGHNILGEGPLLDPSGLQENGGPTETIALEDGSPAIDAGDNVLCQAPPPRGLGGVDQRGLPRSRAGDPICDIGAFEFGEPVPGQPTISSIPSNIEVGSSFNIIGTGFTHGSVVNFFIATATGSVNEGPLTPSSRTSTLLTVSVPDTTPLGQGFVSVEVVNTDTGFKKSNLGYALLQGDATQGIPTIEEINGKGLAATSSDPNFATNNVETVVPLGSLVKIGGEGLDTLNGVAIDLFCDCPGGKVGPFFLNPGNPGLTSTQVSFILPAKGMRNSPSTGPGSFVVSNKGAGSPGYAKKSNAVSVPIGAQIAVSSVSQLGSTITVNGSGFSTLTVINFFNTQGANVVNLGGLGPGGKTLIPLTVASQSKFTFARPAGAVSGASYVQALNPPFVPFSSSGNAPGGALTLR